MKRLILATLFSAAALSSFPDRSLASAITFTGVVDQVQAPFNPVHFMIGDTFSGTFFFNSGPPDVFGNVFGPITHYSVTVGGLSFSGTPGGGGDLVTLGTDPSQGSVFYQVVSLLAPNPGPYAFANVDLTMQAATPNGVIPPVGQFNLNDFAINFFSPNRPLPDDVFGHMTSLPTFNLTVPEGGTSMTLLSCGLTGLAVLRCCLRRKSTS
jgi:hypothetical protein